MATSDIKNFQLKCKFFVCNLSHSLCYWPLIEVFINYCKLCVRDKYNFLIEIGTTVHKDENGKIIYSPSDLKNFIESRFITWMDRYYLEFPNQVKPDDYDELLKIRFRKGYEHEGDYLDKLKSEGRDVVEISQGDRSPEARKNSSDSTKKAISEGREIIYQAYLSSEDAEGNQLAGYADFLFRVNGDSRLGNYHYEPWDTKLASKVDLYFIVQLCAYAEMLEAIQSVLPKCAHVILGNGEVKSFKIVQYFDLYKQLKDAFLRWQISFNPQMPSDVPAKTEYGRWTSYAKKKLVDEDHLRLVYRIKKEQIKKLKKSGVFTLTQLVDPALINVPNLEPSTLKNLKQQASLQLQSRGKIKPVYQAKYTSEDQQKEKIALLPPASTNDVWFDMEGYPLVKGGLEYLFGVVEIDPAHKDELIYKDWWAHDAHQEEQSFQDFVTWVYDCWKNDPTMHIYHYDHYEVTALKRLMGRYGKCEGLIDNLLRENVFIDLRKVVDNGLWVGVSDYSLKTIEHLYRPARTTAVAKGGDSIVQYDKWRQNNDGFDWQTSKTLEEIRAYNRDDCESTKLLCDWLRKEDVFYVIKSKQKQKTPESSLEKQFTKLLKDLIEESNEAV
ncbi:MAG: hypothetical protein UV38_C0002G0187 [candidate division TM6 bacterium GW2011_GWE2_42_60]|nr:MAG: hypothetical protein UV38_C0002G0187 [candidate division TM6 bacterium GW2011_GWE2_42_60]HBY06058.1 hypothetical protein [Candidatus Dependentiae bacterium]